ncbi:hypothetical protein AM571_PC00208 (plasmid) [Rhizobium etli 8C-3]|uniref:Uncharacterized protein n=1 Tax=Rhizobium etli 8C-3 TaxID=538025 RepID=A0A1L5PCP8_RHIET|nr:hypothetical protein AM571_PC00208 [Rhizobium etli 8C-3]
MKADLNCCRTPRHGTLRAGINGWVEVLGIVRPHLIARLSQPGQHSASTGEPQTAENSVSGEASVKTAAPGRIGWGHL